MYEKCQNLNEYEKLLSEAIKDVTLLGDIPYTTKDLDHLTKLVRETITPDVAYGTRFLKQHAPTSLACFLVWIGTAGYQEGNYWSAVEQAVGLIDTNWRVKWGQYFNNYLENSELLCYEIEGALAYVTPILIHGGIPDSCLDEFFEKVLGPLVQRELMDPNDPEEIVYELNVRREDQEARTEFERSQRELLDKKESLERRSSIIIAVSEAYDDLLQLWELESSSSDKGYIPGLPQNYPAFRKEKLASLQEVEDEIKQCELLSEDCSSKIAAFSDQDRQILAHAQRIEQLGSQFPESVEEIQRSLALDAQARDLSDRIEENWVGISAQSWDNRYGETILQLPMDNLSIELGRLETTLSEQTEAQDRAEPKASPQHSHPFSRWFRLVFLISGVVALIALSIWAIMSYFFGFVGVFLILLATYFLWKSLREDREKPNNEKVKEPQLIEQDKEIRSDSASVIELLSGLPVSNEVLKSVPGDIYPVLSIIAELYEEESEIRGQMLHLEEGISQRRKAAVGIAEQLSIDPEQGTNKALIEELIRALRESVEKDVDATEAETYLREEVKPALENLRREHENVSSELDQVERRLHELGDGDIQAGIRRSEAWLQDHTASRDARDRLSTQYSNLSDIESELQNAQLKNRGKAEIKADAADFKDRLDRVADSLNDIEKELSTSPVCFPGVDEPIRRYLLYGYSPAEDFLIGACRMMDTALTSGEILEAGELNLPDRVVSRFESWWELRSQEVRYHPDEIDKAGGQRFRAPRFSLDPATREITVLVRPQRITTSLASADLALEVSGEGVAIPPKRYPLRLYQINENLAVTQELEFPLPFPSGLYHFRMTTSTGTVQQWELVIPSQRLAYFAFAGRSQRLIRDESLPKEKISFLLHKDYKLQPEECILYEAGALYGPWNDYVLKELDLETIDELKLINLATQRSINIPVSFGEPPSLGFVGGHRLEGVHSEGLQVYTEEPPRIRIPVSGEAELKFWRFSIFPGEDCSLQVRKHFRLSELKDALLMDVDQEWAELCLTHDELLGNQALGSFQVRIHKSPYTDWRRTFCVIPKIEISYGRPLYFPYEKGSPPTIDVEVSIPENAKFNPLHPAKLMGSNNGRLIIRAESAQDSIAGKLTCHRLNGDISIPLSLPIPKIRWRFQGLEDEQFTAWNDTIDEVWVGDSSQELFLILKTPTPLEGKQLSLGVGGKASKRTEVEVLDQRARFELQNYADAFRGGPPVQELSISSRSDASDLTFHDAPIVKVRTRWEVEDMQCVQIIQGESIILEVTWVELGKAAEKMLRLWRVAGSAPRPIHERSIRGESNSAKLIVDMKKLSPGSYLLHLEPRDPWSTTIASRPSNDDPNTLLIQIVSAGDLRRGQAFQIETIEDDRHKNYMVEIPYTISIVGKIVNQEMPTTSKSEHRVLVTKTNEGWYAARLSVNVSYDEETLFVNEIEDANPVKFEYGAAEKCVTAIEDRYGEGAMFCVDCGRLYWCEERLKDEVHRKHTLLGPIEMFRIHWKR